MRAITLTQQTLKSIASILTDRYDDVSKEYERREEELQQGDNSIYLELDVISRWQESENYHDEVSGCRHEDLSHWEHEDTELVVLAAFDKEGNELRINNRRELNQYIN